MDVFEIGTKVLLDGEHRLTYEVTWWDERDRKAVWVDPFEIRAQEEKRHALRFVAVAK